MTVLEYSRVKNVLDVIRSTYLQRYLWKCSFCSNITGSQVLHRGVGVAIAGIVIRARESDCFTFTQPELSVDARSVIGRRHYRLTNRPAQRPATLFGIRLYLRARCIRIRSQGRFTIPVRCYRIYCQQSRYAESLHMPKRLLSGLEKVTNRNFNHFNPI